MKFIDIILNFKQKEEDRVEGIMPLMDDSLLRNGIAAWQSVIIERTNDEDCPFDDLPRQWDWTWTQIKFDKNQFGIVAGYQIHETANLFTRLKGLRLIYPDGSVNGIAKGYLKALARAKLPKTKSVNSPSP